MSFSPGLCLGVLIAIVTNLVACSDSPPKPVFPANYKVHGVLSLP